MASVYGTAPFNKVQLGRETTPGTSVAATTIWRGPFAAPEDGIVRVRKEEDIGALLKPSVDYTTRLGATIAFPSTELSFEQILHVLEASFKTATPGGEGPYVYAYSMPVAAARTIKTYTIEAGNVLVPTDAAEFPHSFVQEFTLSGKVDEAWMVESTWLSARWVNATMTSALSVPSVDPAIFGLTEFYVDDSGGTIGTTQVTGKLLEVEIKLETGLMFVPAGDGNLYPIAIKYTEPKGTIGLSYELEEDTGASFVAAERAAWKDGTGRLMRFAVTGTGDNAMQIDAHVLYDKVGSYENSDGNVSVKAEGTIRYSSADSLFMEIEVTNGLSAVQ